MGQLSIDSAGGSSQLCAHIPSSLIIGKIAGNQDQCGNNEKIFSTDQLDHLTLLLENVGADFTVYRRKMYTELILLKETTSPGECMFAWGGCFLDTPGYDPRDGIKGAITGK